YPVWMALGLCLLGCDPVRTTTQQVRLRLIDSMSGQPVAGAQLLLKDDFDANYRVSPETPPPGSKPEEYRQHLREFWERKPWFRGVAGVDGEAVITVRYTALDRSRGAKPPAQRDWVSGMRYLVEVKQQLPAEKAAAARKDAFFEETVSLMMEAGQSAK